MKKEALKKLDTLTATPKMMRMAVEDIPKKTVWKSDWGTEYEQEASEYRLLLRCRVIKGILKVSFFLPEAMRLGGKLPAYELYLDRKRADFITYDRRNDRWLTAKLDRINWPRSVGNGKKHWISPDGNAVIKRYLNTEKGGYEGILDYQLAIRKEQLKARHRRETDPWDRDLAQTRPLPKDWTRWVDKVGIRANYIFYQYARGGAKTGYCTFCGKEVPIAKPRHNKTGHRRRCRHEVTFKAIGRMPRQFWTPNDNLYLLQRCADGFMIRQFYGYRRYEKGKQNTPEIQCQEVRRAIFSREAKPLRAYYWGDYKHIQLRWIECEPCNPRWNRNRIGCCYGKTLPSLAAHELHFTALPEMIRALGSIDPEKYLAIFNEMPLLEQFVKADLHGMVDDCLERRYLFYDTPQKSAAGGLAKRLGIDTQELKRLRENEGGFAFLDWLQHEKSSGKPLPDDAIRWLCQEGIDSKSLKFILDRMNVPQTINYIQRQMRENQMSSRNVLITWKDYLSMAERLGMDTGDAIVYRARKLRLRHDELVKQMHLKELPIAAREILERFPNLEEVLQDIQNLYPYRGKKFSVIAPVQIEQILKEGRALHHCVDSSDRYWDRIERRESYILFLRRNAEPEKAWYTIEIEPDGTVRQKRTAYDRQDKDIGKVRDFLREWQKQLAKQLTEKERQLAKVSRSLRIEEFAQLQKDGVVIRAGDLQGQLLADVLMADLMEINEAVEALPAAA